MLLAPLRTELIEYPSKTLWSEREISFCRRELDLSQIAGKGRKHAIQVGTTPDPRGYSMHGESRSEVTHSRLVMWSAIAQNPYLLPKLSESLFQVA